MKIKNLNLIKKIPGPKPLPIIGNLLDLLVTNEELFEVIAKYGKIYAPIFRLILGFHSAIFISSPEDIQIIVSGVKHLNKNNLYIPLSTWLETGLLTSEGNKWHNRRKLLTPAFHFNILQQFSSTFIEKTENMLEEIEAVVNQSVDVIPLATKYTFSMVCETAMGANASPSHIDRYREAVLMMGKIAVHRIVRLWFHNPVMYLFSPNFYRGILTSRLLHKYSSELIKKREETFDTDSIFFESLKQADNNSEYVYSSKKRLAMLDVLLYAKNTEKNIDDQGIREEVDTFVFEGHDTTSSCLAFTLMLLACNKHIQDKVVEELSELLPNKSDKMTFNILNDMKYLERVIKESLRLYPSVPMFGRLTSEIVKTHSGYELPVNSQVMIRVYDMHRNPNIYPDPEKFDPDRFLPENIKARHVFSYLPFSAGPRSCIGQKFALLELKAMLCGIMRHFEVLPVDTPETIRLITDFILHPTDGIRVKFVQRIY
ncbi:hypothetical protein Trydic_g7691 [Trypoxylus dichotomus]